MNRMGSFTVGTVVNCDENMDVFWRMVYDMLWKVKDPLCERGGDRVELVHIE